METILVAATVIVGSVAALAVAIIGFEYRRIVADEAREPAVEATPTGLERFRRERLLVSHQNMNVAWRGLLDVETEDGIVLDAVEVVAKAAGGKVDIESMPGKVWIPASNILSVQVLRDE